MADIAGMEMSVVLCTHRPDRQRLSRTLGGLRGQSLPLDQWELLVIDSGSRPALTLDLGWNRQARLLREPCPGLTRAHCAGIRATTGAILIFCDDDTVLAPDYLDIARRLMHAHPGLAVAGGRARAEPALPAQLAPYAGLLAVRDLGSQPLIARWNGMDYPACAPIGAGLVVRRAAAAAYLEIATAPDRTGRGLEGGGDCEIVLAALRAGGEAGYFPELELHHLLPASRRRTPYLARLNYATARSWGRLLRQHGLSRWPRIAGWTLPLRMMKAAWSARLWRGRDALIDWAGRCGHLAGQV